jgi:hypothetical protein
MSYFRSGITGLLATAILACAGAASANGRFAAANDIAFNRNNPNHILARTTFGFLQTLDGGQNWNWICEGALRIPYQPYDPPIALMGDGTSVISVTFGGVRTSQNFCNWAEAPLDLSDKLVVDTTPIPGDPAGALLLTSNWTVWGYVGVVWETRDNARTWKRKGSPLPPQVFLQTLEVAPSNPNRIYVSAAEYRPIGDAGATQRVGIFLRTDDGGLTWTQNDVSLPPNDGATTFIAGVDPSNADRVYLRVAHNILPDPNADKPATDLRVSDDRGVTWQTVFTTDKPELGEFKSMLGFALSPDGGDIVLGGVFGVWAGPAPAGPFHPLHDTQIRCLKWTSAGLYACGNEPYNNFTVALSKDGGHTFPALLLRRADDTCPLVCPAGSEVGNAEVGGTCWTAWNNPPLGSPVKNIIAATEKCCGADAGTPACQWENYDAGAPGGSGGAGGTSGSGGTAGTAGSPGCTGPAATVTSGGCSTGSARLGAPGVLAAAVALFLSWRRRRSRPAS